MLVQGKKPGIINNTQKQPLLRTEHLVNIRHSTRWFFSFNFLTEYSQQWCEVGQSPSHSADEEPKEGGIIGWVIGGVVVVIAVVAAALGLYQNVKTGEHSSPLP